MQKFTIYDKKFDFSQIIQLFRVENLESFAKYLTEIWKDLVKRNKEGENGINKLIFSKYYELNGIINTRLFSVFDTNNDGLLGVKEFIIGMTTLFSGNFEQLLKLIFNFYDFDKDGKINSNDIRVVLSYVPITSNQSPNKVNLRYEINNFDDRVEIQNELLETLNQIFKEKQYITQEDFNKIVSDINSDIFISILLHILEKRPFSKDTVMVSENGTFQSTEEDRNKYYENSPFHGCKTPPHFVKKPTIKRFDSPTMRKHSYNKRKDLDNISVNNEKINHEIKNEFNKNATATNIKRINIDLNDYNENEDSFSSEISLGENIQDKKKDDNEVMAPHRKNKQMLNNYQIKGNEEEKNIEVNNDDNLELFRINYNTSIVDDDEINEINYQGFLYKITKTDKFIKRFFRLVFRDLFYFRDKGIPNHEGVHNLCGVFLKENSPLERDGKKYYSFSIIYPLQTRNYYSEDKREIENWLKYLKKAIDITPLNENFDVKENLGRGQFGSVKLGYHKLTGRKVAIKIINKKEMTNRQLELVKTEIDILKICQHPNIIRLYDVIENQEKIYIITEYCSGKDLFSYIEKRGYKLPEKRTAEIIDKLATAVFYIHSFGIVHRDLKPENILMTDNTDEADIRLLDFGLSKIIGPNELCREPYGTLSYVAPEVLLDIPYNQKVDIWSIGVITYLLLCGCLPFDDRYSEREIARKTIEEPIPFYPFIWKKLSKESKKFIQDLLQKNPEKRIDIKDLLKHQWFKKYFGSKVESRDKSSDLTGNAFKNYATAMLNK